MANPNPSHGGLEAMRYLKTVDPPQFLSPSPELSLAARLASQFTFSSLKPHTPKNPFDSLLTDGFDAEQIWQQIDLQSQPLISSLGRQLRRLEKNPDEISSLFEGFVAKSDRIGGLERESEDFEGLERENDDFEAEDEGEDDDEEEEEEEEGGGGGIEDKFLKIKELEEYLEAKEDEEYGLEKKKKRKGGSKALSDDEEEEDEDDDEDDEELEMFGGIGDDKEGDELGKERYEDFFSNKKKAAKRKADLIDGSEDSETDEEQEDDQEDDQAMAHRENEILSTHEKQQKELKSEIEKMEKANVEPKSWTMQGEATAATRPKNSALEVDLDFEHNVRPAPVITEEVTATLEELIQKRILEGRFDDVQKAPSLSAQKPKQLKEMDENKSKKGLAELYEEEYVEKINPASAPLSFSDEQKKEASLLFKQLCLKLDALSHFHFAPKPVIEDMSIQTNVPALAMEEIAPVAVSDAAMLAPEEVFAGEGDIKEETELTQAERKRRRANKKRKFKAETAKREAKKAARDSTLLNSKEEGTEKE